MSAKSSKTKSVQLSWVRCDSCVFSYTFRDIDKHRAVCPTGSKSKLQQPSQKTPLYHNGLFLLKSVEYVEKDIHLPKTLETSLVQLSPVTMKQANIYIGMPAIVTSECGLATVVSVWPMKSLSVGSMAMSRDMYTLVNTTVGQFLSLEGLYPPYNKANQVTLRPRLWNDFMKDEAFLDYLNRKMRGGFLSECCPVELSFYGKTCQFIVFSVTQSDEEGGHNDTVPWAVTSLFEIKSQNSLLNRNDSILSGNETRSSAGGEFSPANISSPANDDTGLVEMLHDISITGATDCSTPSKPKVSHREELKEKWNEMMMTPGTVDSSVISENGSLMGDISLTGEERIEINHRGSFLRCMDHTQFIIQQPSSKSTPISNENIDPTPSDVRTGNNVVIRQTLDNIGGLSKQLLLVEELITIPLKTPEVYKHLGLVPPRGVLLVGPSGVGKTMLVRAIINKLDINTTTINGGEIISKYYGETEAKLRDIFQQSKERAPSVILIDDIESLCPRRDSVNSEVEKRVVSTLISLMDQLSLDVQSAGHVMVLATTNRPDGLDTGLRRAGRFDNEIELPIPSSEDRIDILYKILQYSYSQHSLTSDDIRQIAESAHGYVGADLAAVCKEASMIVFRRWRKCDDNTSVDLTVNKSDITLAMTCVKPSAMREIVIDVPKVYWTDVGGQDDIKQKLKQAIEWPLKHPEAFRRMGIKPPKGVLMYGPPGCSKTLIAKALATESGLNFLSVKGPELFNKYVGETERSLREIFKKARSAAPAIIFFDEIDAIAVNRGRESGSGVGDRVLAQLLTELDGIENLNDVTIIAATNRPDIIDKALLRPGRLDRVVYVPLPTQDTRREIFKIQFRRMPIHDQVNIDHLVHQTEHFSGAEVISLCNEAALLALQKNIECQCITKDHFQHAFAVVNYQTSTSVIETYELFHRSTGIQRL